MKPLSCIFNRHTDALVEVTTELLGQATKRAVYINVGYKVTTRCLRCQRIKIIYKFQLTPIEEAMLQLYNIESKEIRIPCP
ncbi:MAG: hypothetical protein WC365_06790 [Candidatus Babeliales bacterium]